MLYVMDYVLLVGCILVFSAGIVWALRSDDYSRNPLHRMYRLLSSGYLRLSEVVVNGFDALKERKDEFFEQAFGSRRVSFAAGGTGVGKEWKDGRKGWNSSPAGNGNREFKRKILK